MASFNAFRSVWFSRSGKVAIALGISATGVFAWKNSSCVTARELSVQEMTKNFMAKPLSKSDDLEKTRSAMKTRMELMILRTQGEICKKLAEIEGNDFRVDRWERKEGGGGISCVIQDGMSDM